ncbi:MAG: hypothetical protein LBS70_08035 [Candidatus Accumulibacter sp.]|jgi:hypothetical protein|nr:hypothetical protein [Accumulibacter sp.]
MPQIILQQPGQAVAEFSVSGAVITVAGVEIDCAARETDAAQTIEIRKGKNGRVREGGTGAFLAQIEIPARRYVDEPGEPDEDGQPTIVSSAVPFDANRVAVTLWPA